MKIRLQFVAAIAALSLFPVGAFAADYTLDPAHTSVTFKIRHMVSRVQGEFKDFGGNFSFDPKSAGKATGQFTVKTASISTDNEKRDQHLRSADFFDVTKYPEMTLTHIKLVPHGKNKYKLHGDLTLHGVTKAVIFDTEFLGSMKDPWGNTKAGFSATGKINRKDFGIVWNKTLDAGGLLLGDDVMITLNVEAQQQAAKK